MSRISQQQLESYLWGAATLLRGTIDAGDYKQFIFPLLFYKRLCDVFDEETKTALAESQGDKEFAAYPENHRFQIPPEAHWNETRKVAKNVGAVLQNSLRAIETANPDKLYGIFGDAQWTNKDRLPDAMLRDLIEHFSSLELTIANLPEDELGNGYEYLIKKFADDAGHTAAEFYTNRTVVHLMTELLQPQSGESIYDPTCGSGGMPLSCVAHLRRQGKEWRNVRIYGQERNLMTSSIARMNCFLHGIEGFRIERGDTLVEPKFLHGDRLQQFDVVLANPPYSIKQWDREAFSSDPWGRNIFGTPPQGRADYAFWQHIIQSMNPQTGRCAILFPHGVLFRQEEAEMRRKLIEADLIECVIGLGPNLFYNSPMEACVVICCMVKLEKRRDKVLFIDAVGEVTRERAQSFLTEENMERIVKAYQKFEDELGFTCVASLEKIRENDFRINIPLYISNTEHRRTGMRKTEGSFEDAITSWFTDVNNVRASFSSVLGDNAVESLSNLDNIKAIIPAWLDRSKWEKYRFDQIAENIRESVMPTPKDSANYIGLEHMDSGSLHVRRWGSEADLIGQKLRMRKGDILFARRNAYLRRVAIAPHDGLFSAHGMILRAKSDLVLPEFLPFLMMSNHFMNRAVGISVGSLSPTINWTALKGEKFSIPPLDQQQKIVEINKRLDAVQESIFALSDKISRAIDVCRNDIVLGANRNDKYTLSEACDFIVDCPHSTPTFTLEGILVVRNFNIKDGTLDLSEPYYTSEQEWQRRVQRLVPMPGDIVFSREAPVGEAFIVPEGLKFSLGQRTMLLRPSHNKIRPAFLLQYLYSSEIQKKMQTMASGTTVSHLNVKDIRQLPIPLPPIAEQDRLLKLMQPLISLKVAVKNNITIERKFQTSLLNSLISEV